MFEVSAGEVISGACVVNMFEVSAGEVISGASISVLTVDWEKCASI